MNFLYHIQTCSIQKIIVTFFSYVGLVIAPLLAATPPQTSPSIRSADCECSAYPTRKPIMHLPPILPPLICNGADRREPAYPVGQTGIEGLSAGDTVARYRRDDGDNPNNNIAARSSHIARTNCECIYAPRFGSVRNVTRLHEESAPLGPARVSATKALPVNNPSTARQCCSANKFAGSTKIKIWSGCGRTFRATWRRHCNAAKPITWSIKSQ